MSKKEVRRPGLVQAALAEKITNAEGAQALGLSVRQFRRLKSAYRARGLPGLVHGNRGRASPHRLTEKDRARILKLLTTRYAGLNDCHFTEKLRELEGLHVSREIVRRLRRAAGIGPKRRRRPPRHRTRRLREARMGSLVLVDGSEYDWFGTHQPCALLGAIDDATGQVLALVFRPHEDLHGYTELFQRLSRAWGLPVNLYGDRLGVFVRNDPHWTLTEELAGRQAPTQFGRMLEELAIGYIAAGSPEAKGRIERLWQTLQDRLPAELRLAGIRTREAAETYLPHFLADFNTRFAHSPREAGAVWRRPPRHLDRVLACSYARTVARDNTVSIPGRWAQIPPGPRSFHRLKVEVRELLDGRLLVLHEKRLLAEQPAPPGPFTLVPRQDVRRRRLLTPDPAPRPLSPQRSKTRAPKRPPEASIPWRPATDHPWRRLSRNHPSMRANRGRT